MGCGALDYRQQAQQMELRTGGMWVSTQIIPDVTELDMYEQVRTSSVCVRVKVTRVQSSLRCCRLQFHISRHNCGFVPHLPVIALCSPLSGHPSVLLLPGEEPPSHVSAVGRHIQQVCDQKLAVIRSPLRTSNHECDIH